VLALVLAVVLSPLIIVIAIIVRVADGRPVILRLPRVGQGGEVFRMWKFRTMRPEEGGSVLTSARDDRITRSGAALRHLRLDELPQLWNVMRGEMTLFGPRPETPEFVDADDTIWKRVLTAPPGIAGITQLVAADIEARALLPGSVEQLYRTRILPAKLSIDAWYVEHASLKTDLVCIVSLAQRLVRPGRETAAHRLASREVGDPGLAELLDSPAAT